MPSLISVFDVTGLVIRPDIDDLEVADLSASYVGDNLRLSGRLKNNGSLRTHAADLRVTVTSQDGVIMNEVVLKTEQPLIDAGGASDFFVQLDVEQSAEANVMVVPLANRIYQ